MPRYERPSFWRVPHQRTDPDDRAVRDFGQRKPVTPGSPAGRELLRGDIIAKIDDYDARDLRHEDAQNLFKNAPNHIKLVVQRTPSPHPLPSLSAARGPESLPRTPVPAQYSYPPQWDAEHPLDESIHTQPYRTTPLVLPGAKVRREPGPTESYLRHHPNPAMRAPPSHDYRDTLMKQKVAESVIHRVVGDEPGNKLAHKQYNSPINLYSDQNIATSVRQQSSPQPYNGHYTRSQYVKSHKPTLLYDPAKSETFRALQETGLGPIAVNQPAAPVTSRVFTPLLHHKRPIPTPKPTKQLEATPAGKPTSFVSALHEEQIQQSNSFKRLMYNVLGDAQF